ncbi:MAG: hypothetical protein DMD92_17325 [Candidatus Rokuibacteriota bacterium]|nr:MAG: hypothetical protein DMD92_17325 [Candidatus Rokubacteria bacterium]
MTPPPRRRPRRPRSAPGSGVVRIQRTCRRPGRRRPRPRPSRSAARSRGRSLRSRARAAASRRTRPARAS